MLTKTAIDTAKPASKPLIVWDDELGGFGCKIHPTGRRSFVVQYRLRGSRRLYQTTLGEYGALTVAQARKQALGLLARARLGDDPLAERKARAAAEAAAARVLTLDTLVQQYIAALRAGQANTKRLRGRAAAEGYVQDTALQLRRFAAMHGAEAADAVTRAHVLRLLDGYVGQPAVHRRMHGAISRMYTWAFRRALVTNNPAQQIETTSPAARERVLSLEELARIWRAAEDLGNGDGGRVYRDVVHLLILTGQRRAEVAAMCWGEIDFTQALWTLPAARTKARRQHALPLAPTTVAVLQARSAAFKRDPAPDDLVLPTLARDGRSIAPISGWNWLKRELDRRSGVTGWRLHDFRRSLVTICAERGADVAVLDTMLNHASSATRGGVIGTYQRATLIEPMRRLVIIWDGLLREALDPAPATAPKVVALADARR